MTEVIILLAVLAAAAVFFAVRRFRFKKRECRKKGYIVIPCCADTKDLERTVRSYYWEEVFENPSLGREILVVLMERSENDYIAGRLSQELSIVKVTDISGLEDYLIKKEVRCHRS
ncbi:MAG: hypothetical protein ACI4JA_00630 [Oscillospiraceae bacterium]